MLDVTAQRLLRTLTRVKGGTSLARPLLRFLTRVVLRRDLICQVAGGFRVHVSADSLIETHLCLYDRFEPDVQTFLAHTLRSNHVLLDVGANIGCFTLQAAVLVGSSGHVFGFEPAPGAFKRLSRNVELNRFPQVHLFDVACGRKAESKPLFRASPGEFSDALGSLYPSDWHDGGPEACSVQVRRLDDWGDGQPARVDVMKIDVEGAELDVLLGATETIARHRPAIVME